MCYSKLWWWWKNGRLFHYYLLHSDFSNIKIIITNNNNRVDGNAEKLTPEVISATVRKKGEGNNIARRRRGKRNQLFRNFINKLYSTQTQTM